MGHVKDHQRRKKYLSIMETIVVMLVCFGMGVLVGIIF